MTSNKRHEQNRHHLSFHYGHTNEIFHRGCRQEMVHTFLEEQDPLRLHQFILFSGDKLNTLVGLVINAMQHGMTRSTTSPFGAKSTI